MLQTKYITLDEFQEYFPEVNLIDELKSEASAYALLVRTEDRMEAFLNSAFYRNIDKEYPIFTDYQKKHYKLALIEQVFFTYKTGDISVDNGYEPEKGVIASSKDIYQKMFSPNTIQHLILCNLWCRKIRNHRDIWSNWL